jgi:PTS system galactitol-specific IIC component
MFALERIERKIPGLARLHADPASVRKRLGLLGEPILMGALLGLLLGTLGSIPDFRDGAIGKAVKDVLTLSVSMAAVLIVLPKMVAILMEGLIPISEGAREYLQRRFPGRDVLIGLDAAVVIGHPANMAVALLCVPLALLLALVLPGNRMLPFGDLAALPFYLLWGVAASRGNMVRGLINAVFILCGILWIGTSLAPLTTELARTAHFAPEGMSGAAGHYREWSGVALGSHVIPWIVLSLFRPGSPAFVVGVIAAIVYGGVWWWVRGEIRSQYADSIAAKASAQGKSGEAR